MSSTSEIEFLAAGSIVRSFLGDAAIAEVVPVTGGFSGANVFRVSTSEGEFSLRTSSTQAEPFPRTLERSRFLRHLSEHGIPVAVPRTPLHSSEPYLIRESLIWQLEPWLPGRACTSDELNDDRLIRLMQCLAAKHSIAATYCPTPLGKDWFECRQGPCPAVQDRLRIIESFSPSEISQLKESLVTAPEGFRELSERVLASYHRCAAIVHSELQTWREVALPLHPCWRDLWSEHVLFSGDEVTGWIDPVACRTDHPATDLSRLLGSLFADDFSRWDTALGSYAGVASLQRRDRQLVHTLDRSSVLLSGMNWINRYHQGAIPPDEFPAVEKRLEQIATRIERLEPRSLR